MSEPGVVEPHPRDIFSGVLKNGDRFRVQTHNGRTWVQVCASNDGVIPDWVHPDAAELGEILHQLLAHHDQRVTELLRENTAQVERRRELENRLLDLRGFLRVFGEGLSKA